MLCIEEQDEGFCIWLIKTFMLQKQVTMVEALITIYISSYTSQLCILLNTVILFGFPDTGYWFLQNLFWN